MRAKATLTAERRNGAIVAWVVRWPVPGQGNRATKYFKPDDEKKAKAFLKEKESLRKVYGEAAILDPADVFAVNAAREELDAARVSLADAIRLALDCLSWERALAEYGESLESVVNAKLAQLAEFGDPVSVNEAVAAFLERQASGRTSKAKRLKNLKSRLSRFTQDHGDRMIAEVKAPEIDHWLNGLRDRTTGEALKIRSLIDYRETLRHFFEFSKFQGWLSSNPVDDVPRPRMGEIEIGILTPEEMQALLTAADPRIIPSIVLAGFCGLRREEIIAEEPENVPITWERIDLNSAILEVPARSKTGFRVVDLEETAVTWLRQFEQRTGPVAPPAMTWRRLWRKAREDAQLADWPRNALRDSFCTYWMAIHRDMPRCADLMGNSVEMVRRHYRASIRPEVAKQWWAILPTK